MNIEAKNHVANLINEIEVTYILAKDFESKEDWKIREELRLQRNRATRLLGDEYGIKLPLYELL